MLRTLYDCYDLRVVVPSLLVWYICCAFSDVVEPSQLVLNTILLVLYLSCICCFCFVVIFILLLLLYLPCWSCIIVVVLCFVVVIPSLLVQYICCCVLLLVLCLPCWSCIFVVVLCCWGFFVPTLLVLYIWPLSVLARTHCDLIVHRAVIPTNTTLIQIGVT